MDVDEQQIDNAANNGSSINGGGVGSDAESHPNDNNNNINNENGIQGMKIIMVVDHLHNNDPSCDSIWIWSSHMNPLDIDWGKEGSAMSENTRLKSLDIEQFESEIKSDRERRYPMRREMLVIFIDLLRVANQSNISQ